MSIHDNRLTKEDEEAILARIAETVAHWQSLSTSGRIDVGPAREALRRVAFHAIGCSEADLRDVEIAWIDEQVARALPLPEADIRTEAERAEFRAGLPKPFGPPPARDFPLVSVEDEEA